VLVCYCSFVETTASPELGIQANFCQSAVLQKQQHNLKNNFTKNSADIHRPCGVPRHLKIQSNKHNLQNSITDNNSCVKFYSNDGKLNDIEFTAGALNHPALCICNVRKDM